MKAIFASNAPPAAGNIAKLIYINSMCELNKIAPNQSSPCGDATLSGNFTSLPEKLEKEKLASSLDFLASKARGLCIYTQKSKKSETARVEIVIGCMYSYGF